MQGNLIRYSSIIRLATLALLTFCIVQPTIRSHSAAIHTGAAQHTHIDLYQNIWLNPGLARGQTLRYNWANLNDPDTRKRILEPSRIRVRLLGADGIVIAQTEADAVGAGQLQFFDFNRDQISLPGEDPTGRMQTVLEATVMGQARSGNSVLKQEILESFDDSVEIIDNSSGRTTVGYRNPKSFQIISAGKDSLIGIVPGQRLQVSALNTHAPAPGADGRKYASQIFQVTAIDSNGRVIAQSDEITLSPGESHSFDIKRGDLPLSGEPGERLQARIRVIWKKLQLKTEFPSLVELVDEITGRTTVLISQKPKEIVVVGSK